MQYQATSRAAWRAHNPGPVNASILSLLEEAGTEGLTCEEIEVLLDLNHQTASGNIAHMKNGTMNSPVFIEVTGEKARTRAGRFADKLRLRETPGAPRPKVHRARAETPFYTPEEQERFRAQIVTGSAVAQSERVNRDAGSESRRWMALGRASIR